MSTRKEFLPINPMILDADASEKYYINFNSARYLDPEHYAEIKYKGSDPFFDLVERHCIGIGTLIRVFMYGMLKDPQYVVLGNGLVRFGIDDLTVYLPEDVLGIEKASEGWSLSGQTYILENMPV